MSIDLTRQTPIPLADVPKLAWLRGRGGTRLNIATVHRWCTRGIRGRRLEFVQRGGTRVTTEDALLAFFASLTPCEQPGPQPTHSNDPQRRRTNARVEDSLDRLGL